MKLKVNDSGLPIQLSPPVPKPAPNFKSSPNPLPVPSSESELSKRVLILWSLVTLFLNTGLILVAVALTLCDILDLETDSKLKLIYLPVKIEILLTDLAPRFLVTVIGFMLSVVILVLERNANYQSWDAAISLLWFTAQISHLPEISNYFPSSQLFIFKCILSASLASLSIALLIFHSFTCAKLYYRRDVHKPRDVRSINPSHKELVQSFKENSEIISKNSSPESSLHQTPASSNHNLVPSTSSISPYRNLIIQPDSALRKRLAGLSIDKNIKVKHCTTEDEPFDNLLEKLGTNLKSTHKNLDYQEINEQRNWITSGFWATRCYGNEMNQKEGEGDHIETGIFASFSASWSRFIPDGSGAGILSNVTQKMIKITNQGTKDKVKFQTTNCFESLDMKTVVQPSKLNLLSQLSYK